jgi:hypothetical protein
LDQVYKFRKPMTNNQVLQNTLLKYKWVHAIIVLSPNTICSSEASPCTYIWDLCV